MGNEEEPVVKKEEDDDEPASNITVDPPLQRVGDLTEIVEVTSPDQIQRWQDLVIDIPARALEDAGEDFVINMPLTPATPRRVNFSPMPSPSFTQIRDSPGLSSLKSKSTFKALLPKLSFKYRNTSSDIERAAILALGSSFAERMEKPKMSRTLSLTKFFAHRTKRTSSLPVTPIAHSNPESMHGGKTTDPQNSGKGALLPIHRSRSVPVLNKDGSIKQVDSLGGVVRVIPTTPQVPEGAVMTAVETLPSYDTDKNEDGGEDIPLEEAVCRICLIELGEGAETLKMECSCKGELALSHQECAVKWFSIKGNKTCDVCKQEVCNLPVTLLRLRNVQASTSQGIRGQQVEVARYRVWQDIPVLVIVSMLAYFCFLEELLVGKMKSGAIAISLPFSCILGLLASMTATTMAVVSVLLATFSGFGVTMCSTSIYGEVFKWWIGGLAHSRQQPVTHVTQMDQLSITVHQTQTDPQQHETEIRDTETARGTDLNFSR